MASFLVTLADQTDLDIDGADAYCQEGPLTTFFRLDDGRRVIDSWSVRVASVRTTDIVTIRRDQGCRARRGEHRSADPRGLESRSPDARTRTGERLVAA